MRESQASEHLVTGMRQTTSAFKYNLAMPSTVIARSLPYWAQVTSFVAAVVGFVGTAFLGLSEYFKYAELEIKLTKDCFYRFIDRGEAVFCRVTVIARGGPVLIKGVSVNLLKTDGATKTFPLNVEQFGTLVPKAEQMFQEHNYYGRSVLHYLPADKPERLVYLCLHQPLGYAAAQAKALNAFEADASATKGTDEIIVDKRSGLTDEQNKKMDEVTKRHLQTILGSLEIEPGSYRLSIKIEYESTSARFRRWRKPRTSYSALTFVVPPEFQHIMARELVKTLNLRAAFLLFGINEPLLWPTLTPNDFTEV